METDIYWLKFLPSSLQKRLLGRHAFQVVMSNAGWLFIDKILRMGVGLFVSVWVARYLGPSLFGALNFAAAFVALFATLASLGLDGIVVRDIVRTPEKKHEILASAFALKLSGGVLALCASQIAIRMMRPEDGQAHLLVGILAGSMIFQAFDAIDLWFQSQVQSKYSVYAKNSAFVLLAVVKVVLILNHASITAFAWAWFAEILLGSVGLVMAYRLKKQSFKRWEIHLSTVKALLNDSWPLILSGLAIMIYMRIDQLMLGQLLDNGEVGRYSAALKFSEIWYFVPSVIVSSVAPSLIQAKSISEKLYYQRIKQLFNLLTKVSYLIAIPMTFLARPIIVHMYGSNYAESGTILAIHIWAAIFVFLGVGASPWFINEGMIKYSLYQTFSGAIINVVLNLYLIPVYGGIGAAIATVVSYCVSAFLFNLFLTKTRKIFSYQLKALLLMK